MLPGDTQTPLSPIAQGLKLDNDTPMLVLGIETTCDETAAAVVERQSDGGGESCPTSCARRPRSMPPIGGVVPEIAARAHVDVLDGIVDRAMKEAGVGFAQLSAVAAAAGPGLIGGVIVGPDHREGDRDGARHAADRGEPSRGPRADAAADLRAGVSLLPVPRLRRSHPDRRRASASANMCGSAPPSTTPWARPSTRSQKCSGLPYPGGPEVERAARGGDPDALCLSAADARARRRQFLAVGIEDRGAQRGQPARRRWSRRTSAISAPAFRRRCWNRPPTG